jgi:hypothetical protein
MPSKYEDHYSPEGCCGLPLRRTPFAEHLRQNAEAGREEQRI